MKHFRNVGSVFAILFLMVVLSSAKISDGQRSATFIDYLEELTGELRISKNENLRFIFDKGFLQRNTNAEDKTKFTSCFDTSAIDITNTFKLHLAFLKFPRKEKVISDFNVYDEVNMAWKTQVPPVNTTQTTEFYDLSWLLDQWKDQRNLGKVKVEFNITNTARKQFKMVALDEEWQQNGPAFLVAYCKSASTTLARPLFTGNKPMRRYNMLRSGIPAKCRLHNFRASFAQLGLSKVYVRPKGLINFSVCYGRCNPVGSMGPYSKYMTPHAFILELAKRRKVFSSPAVRASNLQCKCVPTKYQGLGVLKRESTGNLVWGTIFDLTASACGCR